MKLLFLAPIAILAAASPAPQQEPQRVEVALSNFKFSPKVIQLHAGQNYVLHLTSNGGHSFEAGAFFAAAKIAPEDRHYIEEGKVELDEGQSVNIHLTAPARGTYPVRCTHTLHATLGMEGDIVVS